MREGGREGGREGEREGVSEGGREEGSEGGRKEGQLNGEILILILHCIILLFYIIFSSSGCLSIYRWTCGTRRYWCACALHMYQYVQYIPVCICIGTSRVHLLRLSESAVALSM